MRYFHDSSVQGIDGLARFVELSIRKIVRDCTAHTSFPDGITLSDMTPEMRSLIASLVTNGTAAIQLRVENGPEIILETIPWTSLYG